MVYNLRIWAGGYGPGVEIAEAEYSALVRAIERIYLATGIEEKFDLMLENYLEYERELLRLALQDYLFTSRDANRGFQEIQLINRRVLNLFTAARLYEDLKYSLPSCFATGSAPDVKALFDAHSHRNLECRLAKNLRNYAQHRALPVHKVSSSFVWEEKHTPQQRLRFFVMPSVLIEELGRDKKFDAAVLAELRQTGKKEFPLTPILRRYVESLASVHAEIRRWLSSQAELDHQTLVAALDRARMELHEQLDSFAVSAGEDPELPEEHHYISERSWTRRQFLIEKNSRLSHLSLRYVSAEHPGDTL